MPEATKGKWVFLETNCGGMGRRGKIRDFLSFTPFSPPLSLLSQMIWRPYEVIQRSPGKNKKNVKNLWRSQDVTCFLFSRFWICWLKNVHRLRLASVSNQYSWLIENLPQTTLAVVVWRWLVLWKIGFCFRESLKTSEIPEAKGKVLK